MKKGLLFLLFSSVLFCCTTTSDEQRVKNIEAFAQTYGLVRWFYPADEIGEIDWDKFATYGISQVAECSSSEELTNQLEELFAPIAPGVSFTKGSKYESLGSITPPDTTGMSIVSWQHHGVDLGLWSNYYTSKRTNRPLQTRNVSKLAIEGSCPASDFMDSEVTVSVDIKNNSANNLNIFFRVATISPRTEDHIMFCVADSTLKPILNSGEWQTYTHKLKIKPEHANSLINYGVYSDGEGEFSIKNISISSLDQNNYAPTYAERWSTSVYNYTREGIHYNISTKERLFDEQNHFGDVETRELAPDLFVHVPLALYGTKSNTYPICDEDKLAHLQKEIASTKQTEQDLMAADIIVTWNVIKYFHPYLSDQNVVWDSELPQALNRAFEYETYHSKPLRLMMAGLNDAHVVGQTPIENIPEAVKHIPFRVKKIKNEIVVTHSVDPQLQPGDIIEFANGAGALERCVEFEKLVSGSPHYKVAKAERLWQRSFANQLEVDVKIRRNDKDFEVVIPLIDRTTYVEGMTSKVTIEKSRWMDKNTLYLNFSNTDFGSISTFLKNRKPYQTVIMDIRNGTIFNLHNIIPLISSRRDRINPREETSIRPNIIRPEEIVILDTLANTPAKSPNKKNIFLTGPFNYSNHEETLDYIRYAGLGYFVGTNTGGCNGSINEIPLPSGGKVRFTGGKVLSNMGRDSYYYAIGIVPDLYVKETIDEIIEGRDATIERALNVNK